MALILLYPFLIAFCTILLTYYILGKVNRRWERVFDVLPSPPRYPIIGNASVLAVPNEKLFDVQFEFIKNWGRRTFIEIGNFFYVLTISNPEDIEKVLNSSVHIEKTRTYLVITPWLGDGLLTSKGKKWQKRRKMLTPTFHFKILEDFLVIFNEQAKVLVNVLREDFKDGQKDNIFPYITRCTLDIICETAMDQKINAQTDKEQPYVQAINKIVTLITYRFVHPWYWPSFVFNLTPSGRQFNKVLKELHAFTDKVINERKKRGTVRSKEDRAGTDADELYWHGKRRLAFLDLLLEAQKDPENELTDQDIREEVDTFMFEGHDTTAASVSWTIFFLGLYKEHQDKVQEELDQIFEGDRNRPVTSKDMTEMKYLEMCIKEALRLFPSVCIFGRHLTSDLTLDDKVVIPGNFDVLLFPMMVHYNEKIFPDPTKFDPERFLPENVVGRHPFAYIPFSAGPRNCIGQKFAMMEEKVILANIFRNFRVETMDRREDVKPMLEVITRPKDGINVRLHPR